MYYLLCIYPHARFALQTNSWENSKCTLFTHKHTPLILPVHQFSHYIIKCIEFFSPIWLKHVQHMPRTARLFKLSPHMWDGRNSVRLFFAPPFVPKCEIPIAVLVLVWSLARLTHTHTYTRALPVKGEHNMIADQSALCFRDNQYYMMQEGLL